jgi:hypothetical protein
MSVIPLNPKPAPGRLWLWLKCELRGWHCPREYVKGTDCVDCGGIFR